jgi:HK97 gp10 family phage protein
MKVKWNPLGPITAAIEKKALDRLETAAEQVAERARVLVPVDTGTLKNTIRVVRLKGDPKLNVRVYAGNRKRRAEGGAFYAHMIEYGTVKLKARPFLRPAFNAVKGRVKGIVENG